MHKCSVNKCKIKYFCKGYCRLHYDRIKNTGTTDKRIIIPKHCSIDKCSGIYKAKGLCYKHYQRWLRYGDVLELKRIRDPSRTCKSCDGKHLSNGYCKKHYESFMRKKLKSEIFFIYSKGKMECNCCGVKGLNFLTIDHINNDGNKHRDELRKNKGSYGNSIYRWLKKNNYPKGFQVLCWNCNCGKMINNGICPHKSKDI